MMQSDLSTDGELRSLVISTLDHDPDATFNHVLARLQSRRGCTLAGIETEGLRAAYDEELRNPTGAHRVGAVEAAALARHQPFAVSRIEIAGLAAGLLPLMIHMPSTTPATVARTTGAVVVGGSYDLAAFIGGCLAIILGGIAAREVLRQVSARPLHVAVVGVIILVGVYQVLFGLGLLHRMGVFSAA